MLGVRPTFHARQPSRPVTGGGLHLSRAHKQLALLLSGLALLVLVGFTTSLAPGSGRPLSSLVSGATRAIDDRSDRITLVVVWAGLAVPKYLNLFLRSIEANRAVVDLVFIAKEEAGQCVDLGPALGPNIRFVCLSNRECSFTLLRPLLLIAAEADAAYSDRLPSRLGAPSRLPLRALGLLARRLGQGAERAPHPWSPGLCSSDLGLPRLASQKLTLGVR